MSAWIEEKEVFRLKEDFQRLQQVVKTYSGDIQKNKAHVIPILSKLGRTFFISHICTFLDDKDVNILIQTNKQINQIILSPFGYRVLFFSRSKVNVSKAMTSIKKLEADNKVRSPQKQNNGSQETQVSLDVSSVKALQDRFLQMNIEPGEDFEAQCMSFKHAMQILSSQLIRQIKINKEKKEEISEIKQDLQNEKKANQKYPEKLSSLSEKVAKLQMDIKTVDGESLELQEVQQKELMQLQQEKNHLQNENEALLSQKEDLENQLEKFKEELVAAQQAKETYLQSLKEFKTLIVDTAY